jgi:hypothetical protein
MVVSCKCLTSGQKTVKKTDLTFFEGKFDPKSDENGAAGAVDPAQNGTNPKICKLSRNFRPTLKL